MMGDFLYIRDTCWYVCRTLRSRKTRALWGICPYFRTCDVIVEVLH